MNIEAPTGSIRGIHYNSFEFSHTKKQKELFHDYYNTYGDNKNGLAYILATASALTNKKFYRKATYSS